MFPNTRAGSQSAPANKAFAITPSDTNDLPLATCYVTINSSGVLRFMDLAGNTYTTNTLPAGSYPLVTKRILAAGTTAGGITGWGY